MLKTLRKLLRKERFNEKGAIVVWYVLMTPVFLTAVGLSVDISIAASSKASLQTSLDAATQGTVALSVNQATGKPRLTAAAARASVIKLYDQNRSGIYADTTRKESIPFIQCQANGGTNVVTAPVSGCNFALKDFQYSPTGGLTSGGYLTVTVQEKSKTVFLSFIGIDSLTYTVTSTARLTQTYN